MKRKRIRITLDTLRQLGACDGAQEAAARVPELRDGGLTPSAFLKRIPRGDWLIWWLNATKAANQRQIVMLACVAGRRSLRFAQPEDVPTLEEIGRAHV